MPKNETPAPKADMPEPDDNGMYDIFKKVNTILGNINQDSLSKVTADSSGFAELVPGYYLVSVDEAILTTSKSHGDPQVKLTLAIVDDGLAFEENEDDPNAEVKISTITGVKNRKIFKYYPLKDETTVKRFVSDMLKFEDKDGAPILPAEAYTTAETISDALRLIEPMQVSVSVTVSGEGDKKSTWTNLISWKRAKDLELPVD